MYELSVKHDPYLNIYVDSYVLTTSGHCVFIDSGLYGQHAFVAEKMRGRQTILLSTHGHWDHIGMHKTIQEMGGIVRANPGDKAYFEDHQWHWQALFGQFVHDMDVPAARKAVFQERVGSPVKPQYDVLDGDVIRVGDMEFEVIGIPGHSLGSVCYLEKQSGALFTGDGLIGKGFFSGTPQYMHVNKYLSSMERLKKIACEMVYSDHDPPLRGSRLAAKAQEGIDCCMRIDQVIRDYVKAHETEPDLSLRDMNQAIRDREKRGTGAGTLVTILAHLEKIEHPPLCVQHCLSRYIHGI